MNNENNNQNFIPNNNVQEPLGQPAIEPIQTITQPTPQAQPSQNGQFTYTPPPKQKTNTPVTTLVIVVVLGAIFLLIFGDSLFGNEKYSENETEENTVQEQTQVNSIQQQVDETIEQLEKHDQIINQTQELGDHTPKQNTGTNNTLNENNNSKPQKEEKLLEDVNFIGAGCYGESCTMTIVEPNWSFETGKVDTEFLLSLSDYKEYIKVNIYYTDMDKSEYKNLNSIKIILKSNNQDISNVKNEQELRTAIGLYALGTHSDIFTLISSGTRGRRLKENATSLDDVDYIYYKYTFKNNIGMQYELIYISDEDKLVVGKEYNITFEVEKDMLGYNYYIKSIQ